MLVATRRGLYSSCIYRRSCHKVEHGSSDLPTGSTSGRWNGCWRIVRSVGALFRTPGLGSLGGFNLCSSSWTGSSSCSFRSARPPAQLETVTWLIYLRPCLAFGGEEAARLQRP